MANEYAVNSADLISVADAIRAKGGTTEALAFPAGMVAAVEAISAGAGLNFEVVGGTVQPTNPKENTIWVNTSMEITNWEIGDDEPATFEPGKVWIKTGANSLLAFNVLKQNCIMLKPLNVFQRAALGEWETKSAKIFQNGAWADLNLFFIIKDGNIVECKFSTSIRTDKNNLSVSQKAGYLSIENSGTDGSVGGCTTEKKIDLTNATKIVVDMNVIRNGTQASAAHFKGVSLVVTTATQLENLNGVSSAIVVYAITATTGAQTLELDVSSLTGSYYVGLCLGFNDSNVGNSVNVYNLTYQ